MDQLNDDAWIAQLEEQIEKMWLHDLPSPMYQVEIDEDELPY